MTYIAAFSSPSVALDINIQCIAIKVVLPRMEEVLLNIQALVIPSISRHPYGTLDIKSTSRADSSAYFAFTFPALIFSSAIICFVAFRCFVYFSSELPPLGSGLKRLPGPRSTLPYLGRIHDVDRMHAWIALKKFSDKYNGLFACTLGGEKHIWIAKEDVAQDLLIKNAAISSGRADLGAYPGVSKDYKYLPLLGDTKIMARQRRFAHSVMTRNAASGFQGYIDLETRRSMFELVQRPEDFYNLIYLFCARITSRLAYGHDEHVQEHVANARAFISQLGPSGPAPNLAPFLAHFPEWLVPGKSGVRIRQEKEAKLWKELFEAAKLELKQQGQRKTYVSAVLNMKEVGDKTGLLFEDEQEALYAVGMLCTVAIFTVAGPATLFIMAMVLHPEWQAKIRQQIDDIVGKDLLQMKHNPQLPLLRAAIKECVRWKTTVPMGVPRLLARDYSYDGYHFPKGAVVHVLDIAISQDPAKYENPEVFDPDRWLKESSPNFRGPLTEHPRLKGHHIFGRGKRACPGQDLAESELIVLCGNLLKFFDFSAPKDTHGHPTLPNPDHWTTDVIGGPLPFKCDIKVRDGMKLAAIKKEYEETFA
ncbi:hypothetical protein ACN47E_004480 [Coniothyrium glycines]